MGLVSPDGRRSSQPLPSIGMERAAFARLLDGVNVLVCLDGWIRPIIIGRGHEAYFAANPPGESGQVTILVSPRSSSDLLFWAGDHLNL